MTLLLVVGGVRGDGTAPQVSVEERRCQLPRPAPVDPEAPRCPRDVVAAMLQLRVPPGLRAPAAREAVQAHSARRWRRRQGGVEISGEEMEVQGLLYGVEAEEEMRPAQLWSSHVGRDGAMQVFVSGVDRVALIVARGRAIYYKFAIAFCRQRG